MRSKFLTIGLSILSVAVFSALGSSSVAQSLTSPACGESGIYWKGSPLAGQVTQIFGTAWSANCMDKKHSGIDIDGKAGDKVYAASAGEVVHVGKDAFWGPSLVIKQVDGSARAYLHINPVVRSGFVEAGDLIGTLYDLGPRGGVPEGQPDGDHLHYNVCRQASGCQAGSIVNKQFPGIFLDPVSYHFQKVKLRPQNSPAVTKASGAYDKTISINGRLVPLPEKSRIMADGVCTTVTLKRMKGKVDKFAKCLGQTDYQGVTFVGYSNYSRSVEQPGVVRIFVIGQSVRDLGAVSSEAEFAFTQWNNSNLEVLGFVPSGWNGKTSSLPPFTRYRIEGQPGFSLMNIVSEGPKIGKTTLLQRDRAKVREAIALHEATNAKNKKPSLGQAILKALKPEVGATTSSGNYQGGQSNSSSQRSSAGRSGSQPETKEEIACRFAVWTGVTENIPDLFDCDTPRAIANLSEGRQFTLSVGTVSFSNGKIMVSARQYPSRADYLVDKMNDKSKKGDFWENWSARTSMGAWYTITCIFPANAGARLKEGQKVQVFGKLQSYSNSNPVLICSQ